MFRTQNQGVLTGSLIPIQLPPAAASAIPAAQNDGDIYVLESGSYRITYVVSPHATGPATTSLSSAAYAAYALRVNGAELPGTRVFRPIVDVNIALVLSMRSLVQGGSFTATTYVDLQAGDEIDLISDSNDALSITPTDATLLIERVD